MNGGVVFMQVSDRHQASVGSEADPPLITLDGDPIGGRAMRGDLDLLEIQASWRSAIARIEAGAGVSIWLKLALETALARDAEEALSDAELLAAVARGRCNDELFDEPLGTLPDGTDGNRLWLRDEQDL